MLGEGVGDKVESDSCQGHRGWAAWLLGSKGRSRDIQGRKQKEAQDEWESRQGYGLYLPGPVGHVKDLNPHPKSNEKSLNGFQFFIMKKPFWMKETDMISTLFQKHTAFTFP